jgi:7-cyano-7-deazaguanine synthase
MDGKALVVLSGGQDSTTCLFWAKENFKEIHAVSFDYGQRHRLELEAASMVAAMAGVVSHEIIQLPGLLHSTSPLTSSNELERYENAEQMAEVIGNRVEKTFVPMRNTMFMVVAMNRAIELGCAHLVTGICQEDNANYPDCTEPFRNKFENLVNESLGLDHTDPRAFQIHAPLMRLSKKQTVLLAYGLPGCWDAMAYTHTSYDGKYPPTDKNHANVLRAKGFEDAGLPDPLVLRAAGEGLMALPMTANYDESNRAFANE